MAKKKKIRPLTDRVVVRRLEEGDTTPGGIIIPETAKEKPQKGEVISVGPGKHASSGIKAEMSVKPKDKILFGKYAGMEIPFEGEQLFILREDEVFCIVE